MNKNVQLLFNYYYKNTHTHLTNNVNFPHFVNKYVCVCMSE